MRIKKSRESQRIVMMKLVLYNSLSKS